MILIEIKGTKIKKRNNLSRRKRRSRKNDHSCYSDWCEIRECDCHSRREKIKIKIKIREEKDELFTVSRVQLPSPPKSKYGLHWTVRAGLYIMFPKSKIGIFHISLLFLFIHIFMNFLYFKSFQIYNINISYLPYFLL